MVFTSVSMGPAGTKMFESCDDFVKRVEGVMLLYGAIVQVSVASMLLHICN